MNRKIQPLVRLLVAVCATGASGKQPALAAEVTACPSASASASAGETSVLTLERALRLALENNPELRAATGRVEAAAGRALQTRLWSNPELELSAEDWPTGSGFSDAKQTVGVVQTLPFPGKKKWDRAIGAAGVRLTEAELELRRRELIRDVKQAFFQVLAAQQRVAVAGQLVQVAEVAAQAARKRVEAGAAADQEQLRAEIALEQARAERAGFERDLAAAQQRLVTLLGRPEWNDVPVSGALAETVDAAQFDQAPEHWLAAHPAVVAARTTRERAELELRRARLEPYPDVKLGVAGGREGGPDRSSIVEFRVSLPLPILDRSKGRQQEARANVAVAEAETQALGQRLQQVWAMTVERLRTAAAQARRYRERILPKAGEALRLVQRGFEEGRFGLIDLLDTQRTAAETHRAYVETLLELNLATAELEALIGPMPVPGRSSFSTRPK